MSSLPIDLDAILTIDDLDDCLSFISQKAYRWRGIGLMLKVRPDDLNTINSEGGTDQDKLIKVLSYWLQRRVIEKHSHEIPTLKRLIEVIRADRGGGDPALAEKMTAKLTTGQILGQCILGGNSAQCHK